MAIDPACAARLGVAWRNTRIAEARVNASMGTIGQPVAFAHNPCGDCTLRSQTSDAVALIDTASDRIVAQAPTAGPPDRAPQGLDGVGWNAPPLARAGRRM